MHEKRKHKRFRAAESGMQCKIALARKVDVADISVDGIALRADRRLDMGREYQIQLSVGGERISVKGVVVRSSLTGTENIGGTGKVPIYSAGLMFKEGVQEQISVFLNAIKLGNKEDVPVRNERRRSVRFRIFTQGNAVLSFPIHYTVMTISLSGMLIRTEQALEQESIVPVELSLHEKEICRFSGRIASCRHVDGAEGTHHYDIGVAFLQLGEEGRNALKTFIDYLAATEGHPPGSTSGRENL